MSHRKNRVWLGATRTTIVFLLILAIGAIRATTSWGYMPPPIQAPMIAPDSLPGEDEYLTAEETNSSAGSWAEGRENDQPGHDKASTERLFGWLNEFVRKVLCND